MKNLKVYIAALMIIGLISMAVAQSADSTKSHYGNNPNGGKAVNSSSPGSYATGSTWGQTNDSTGKMKKTQNSATKQHTNPPSKSIANDSAGYHRTPR